MPQGASFQAETQKRRRKKLNGDENVVNYVAYVGSGSPRFYLPLKQSSIIVRTSQFVIVMKDDGAEALADKINRSLDTEFTVLRWRNWLETSHLSVIRFSLGKR